MIDIKETVSKVLNIKLEEVIDSVSRDTTEEWDSFNHLMLMSEIEKTHNIILTIEEIETIKTFKDLRKIVEKK